MTDFILTIEPALPVEERHQIGELLEQFGYTIAGQGQFTDNSKCDIYFSKEGDKDDTP